MLTVLAARPDQVVPRDALAKLVWGDPDTGTSRTIDVHIGRLRVKLTQGGRMAPQIISVRGFGYKIVRGANARRRPSRLKPGPAPAPTASSASLSRPADSELRCPLHATRALG